MPPAERLVEPDHFAIAIDDTVLSARLTASFVLCFYDAVHEAGALVHLRSGNPAKPRDLDLTDTTLSNDLLLIDRTTRALLAEAPKLQHLQARLIAQVDDTEAALTRFAGRRTLLESYLADADVRLVSINQHEQHGRLARFRPSMGKAWVEADAGFQLPP